MIPRNHSIDLHGTHPRRREFSASLITSNTQAVIMDEWTANSLSCEDAKRVLQGLVVAQSISGSVDLVDLIS